MTDHWTQIIERAVQNGLALAQWQHPKILPGDMLYKWRAITAMPVYLSLMFSHDQYKAFDAAETYEVKLSFEEVIFSHDFCKAFFGDKNTAAIADQNDRKTPVLMQEWQYHIQQLALSTDREQYLWNFMKGL